MAKNVRLNLTENEKIAQNFLGVDNDFSMMHMREDNIQDIINREKAIKFNEELCSVADKFENCREQLANNAEQFGDSISNIEIKPMFGYVLIKQLEQNPFQRVKIENGIIVDAGGFTPHDDYNPNTGKNEEQKQRICVGVVQEIGPDIKYLREGDVVFFDEVSTCPIPFFKLGFKVIHENRILSVVNEGLTDRFKLIENGRN